MTPARAKKLKRKLEERAAHLELVVDNPPEDPAMPMILFFALPFIFAASLYDEWVEGILGPLVEPTTGSL